MNKIVKKRLIGSIICFIIGVGCLICCLINHNKIEEDLYSYLNGFSCGIVTVGTCFLISAIRAIRNPKIAQNLENASQDERLWAICNKAMAITFRISILVYSIASVILAILGNMYIAGILGLLIGGQLIAYVIIYYVVAHNS